MKKVCSKHSQAYEASLGCIYCCDTDDLIAQDLEVITLQIISLDDVPANFTGLACVIGSSDFYYFLNGDYHNAKGPAVSNAYGLQWYRHGDPHRLDGPAVINFYVDEYWVMGVQYTKEDFEELYGTKT